MVAEPVVTVDVGIEDGNHRILGDAGDFLEHHLADLNAASRIDDHDPLVGEHEPGVVHESLVFFVGKFLWAVDDVDPVSNFRDSEVVFDGRRLIRVGLVAARGGEEQQHPKNCSC